MSLILSNAYKNSNVYNLITPRKPVLYETFQEVMQVNLTVYSRATKPFVSIDHLVKLNFSKVTVKVDPYVTTVTGQSFTAIFNSEMEELKMWRLASSSMAKTGILNVSRAHPSVGEWLGDVLGRIPKFDNALEQHEFLENRIKTFQQTELRRLSDSLGNCEKIAVVLSEQAAVSLMRDLKSRKICLPTTMGKQVYPMVPSNLSYLRSSR